MKCDDCNSECEMIFPDSKKPEKRFKCPKCGIIFVGVDLFTFGDLELN